jgi:ABC-2 type transport system ATP-binding protein
MAARHLCTKEGLLQARIQRYQAAAHQLHQRRAVYHDRPPFTGRRHKRSTLQPLSPAVTRSLRVGVVIQVIDYHKSYRDSVAVEGLSFDVQPGQVLGLLGPNGAGKTTTMRAIAGIIPPTRGRLLVGGHDVVAEPVAAKQQLAYVPDDPKLFDALTVWEHLLFSAAAYRVKDFEAEANTLLDQFELAPKRNALAMELSRGMRQKVAICAAYLDNPLAILFDEPLTGLDPRGIRQMKASVRDRAAAGAAVVISSHLLGLVEDLCTDLLILHRGRRIYFGPVADARAAIGSDADASLEEVFFKATESATL